MLKSPGASRLPFLARKENALESYASRTWPLAAVLFVASTMTHAQTAAPEQQLQEVVVSASGFEQQVKDAPASISVITREELESNRVSSIAEAVAHVEGIDVTDGIGKTGGLNIQMRGMSSKFTLILIDGRRQNAAGNVTPNGFGETSTSFIPPTSAIERIEIIRGPMATLYGSDAMGGVINIITRKVGKEWAGSITVDGTINEHRDYGDSQSVSLFFNGPIKTDLLGLQVRARKFHRDNSDIQWNGRNPTATLVTGSSPTRADIETVGAKLTLTPNKNHELSLDIDQSRQTYDNKRGQLGTLDTATNFAGYGPTQKFNRDQITLAHTWRFSNSIWDTSLMRNTTETLGRTVPNLTTPPPGVVPGSPRTLESASTIFDTKLVTAIGRNMLSLGGQWLEAEMIEGVATQKFKYRQAAIFAENEWRIRDDLALTLGVRRDDHSTFGGKTSPRAYLVWNTNDNWTVKGGISKAYRTPGLEELHEGVVGYSGQGTNQTLGNPDLKPETSTSKEIGAYFDTLNGFRANLTVFQTDFKNAISSESLAPLVVGGVTTNRSRPINVDEASIQGVEMGSSWDFAKDWKLSANYTWIDSEQKSGANAGRPLNATPKHVLNTRVNWQVNDKTSAWARASYTGTRYRSEDTGNSRVKATLGDYKSYTLVDIGTNYKVSKNLTFGFAINNLLDHNFADYQRVVAANNVVSYQSYYRGNFERRRLWLSANYEF
ncbi:TonB-dependent receptor domain-containing protein [Oxalicibacterium faecigallinarum]|uniref:Exogenous ferric siderophore receptor n=1 Tax=Oxalicibacterium faecigallinarum TaxID=573741 RepID=A0A8J3ATL3_9BURK|nr:TonB-dependent receptor [Oxalicibacterium faecigallinarum]GGI21528.1 exogenous ferric siderophore receptor [Oxalicibacterium faecigallinarum]